MGLWTFLNGCATAINGSLQRHYAYFGFEAYFTGANQSMGLNTKQKREVTRRFECHYWMVLGTEDVGTLEKHFQYYDGETQKKRVLDDLPSADNSYQGPCRRFI